MGVTMKLVTFSLNGSAPSVGIVEGDQVVPVLGFADMCGAIAAGQSAIAAANKGTPVALSAVKLHAPIPRPPKVVCIGLNYRDHAIESGMAIPTIPVVFNKFPNSVIAPGEDVVLPKNSEKPDYEAEFAVILGKPGRHVSKENAMDYVFGYTIVNDVSARDWQLQTSQWIMGKTFDTFCPMGPWIVTADEIADPHNLRIGLRIDGVTVQDSSTKELIFGIPELVEHLSKVFTFEPGDVISTGTPPGVGLGHKPPRWLKPGEVMTVFIEGIGELTNPCVAEE
jgi:2-keto-4-pentenoate hydratase/2-oxohepta-3-ene-1,7-dioic acid hydratase in catechol pathway